MDIVVTLPGGDLEHLEEKIEAVEYNDELAWNEQGYAWWDLKKRPKYLDESHKVFIVCGGDVVGYFTIRDILDESSWINAKAVPQDIVHMLMMVGRPIDPYTRIVFKSWKYIKKIPMKGFQGYRYRRFSYEEINDDEPNKVVGTTTTSEDNTKSKKKGYKGSTTKNFEGLI